jgi:hypothetical protein
MKKRKRKRRISEWVRYHGVKRAIQREIVSILTEMAIEFATEPEREWTGEQIAAILKQQAALHRKFGPLDTLPEDMLPPHAQKLRLYSSN